MNAAVLLLLAATTLSPDSPLAAESADMIEVNHCYNDDGQLIFRQLLFWDWSEVDGEYHVAAYRVLRAQANAVRYDWKRQEFIASWCDNGVLRVITAAHQRETWTQFDPEFEDRRYFPQELRRGLRHESLTRMPVSRSPSWR